MKILCLCQGGNTRSVACAFLLKYGYGEDALAAGYDGNSPETVDMLCEWADMILVMQDGYRQHVGDQYQDKVQVVDVGEDVWRGPDKSLVNLINNIIKSKGIMDKPNLDKNKRVSGGFLNNLVHKGT